MVFAQQTQWVFPQETYRVFMLYYLFSFSYDEINYFFFPRESGCQDSQSYLCCQSYPTNLVFVLSATKSNYCQISLQYN